MKVGVLTYHRVINIGAILQAYCVYEFYRSLQHEVILIDLRSKQTEFNELRKLFSFKNVRVNIDQFNKFRSVRRFVKDNMKVSSKFISGDQKRFAEFCNKKNFGVISVGSDTVWELRPNGYTSLNTNEFFLEHYDGAKISFAASMDPILKFDQFDRLMPSRASAIKKFNFVGVRDEPTRDALKDFGVSSSFTCDPTIVMMQHPIFQVKAVSRTRIGVQLKERQTLLLSRDVFDDYIDVNGHRSSKKKFRSNLTVHQYLEELNKNRILITDRFHGTILTLLVSKAKIPVIMYEDPGKWQSNKSKLRDLAERLNLTEYLCTSLAEVKESLYALEGGRRHWDASKLYERLLQLSTDTSKILKNTLDEIGASRN